MNPQIIEVPTTVPIDGDQSVTIEPGDPWPSAYRGSRYSLISDDDYNNPVLKWKQRDLVIFTEPPAQLRRALVLLGKSGGFGSFRITADSEIITKIPADDYKHTDKAPIDSGWIPVYVGKLEGTIDFDEIDVDPDAPNFQRIRVWKGFPFNHGERWSVSTDGKLIWKWRDYRFESAFTHDNLIDKYQSYRGTAGRLYVTEYGHVWVNVPKRDINDKKRNTVGEAIADWKQQAEVNDDKATLRLVNRRLVATSRSDDPSTGHFPIHLGNIRYFDDGVIPKPVVDEPSYYQAVCEYEQVWE